MSLLLSRLDANLHAASNPVAAAEAKVRKSCYLSRTGYFEESRELIVELRKAFGAGENPRISAWIMLAEGIAEFFQNVGPMAKDRIARAQLIAIAIHDRELGAISSAWKAHCDFEASDFVAMSRSLKQAMELADDTNHEALSRSSLILSNGFLLCGDRLSAQKWFMKSRDHALAEGDQATIDALLYNKAAFGTANLRAAKCFGPLDMNMVKMVRLEIGSAENFNAITRMVALQHLIGLCKARVYLLNNEFELALKEYECIRTARPFAKNNFSQGVVDLERVFCLKNLGQLEEGLAIFNTVDLDSFGDLDLDERLVIAWLRSELALVGGGFGDQALLTRELEDLREAYLSHLSDLRKLLAEVVQ